MIQEVAKKEIPYTFWCLGKKYTAATKEEADEFCTKKLKEAGVTGGLDVNALVESFTPEQMDAMSEKIMERMGMEPKPQEGR